MEISSPAEPTKTADASKARRHRRANMGNSRAVKLMKTAAANAAMESAAGEPGGKSTGSRVETRRRMDPSCAKLTEPWTNAERRSAHTAARTAGRSASPHRVRRRDGINRVSRPRMGNDDSVAMMAPDRRAEDREAAAETVVPLIAAGIIAGAVPAVVVPAIRVVLDCLHERQASERG
jgi:hypothetical protein